MKFVAASVFLSAAGSAPSLAFVPAAKLGHHTQRRSFAVSSRIAAAKPDSSEQVKEAMDASKKFGATSPEAKTAWDAVEEMDAADNSVAFLPSLDEGCLTEEEISQACVDYGDKLDTLQQMLKMQPPRSEATQSLVSEIRAYKMMNNNAGPPAPASAAVKEALENAQRITAEKGATSPEAKLAWAELEEVASAGLGNALGGTLDEECMVDDAMEACQALEEVNQFVKQNALSK